MPHVIQVLVIVCCATADICYVRPADSPLSSCPGQPCLTLHEYVEIDNFTNGTTLQFLPGNHTIQRSFRLEHISNVTFESEFSHSVTNIIYKDDATIYCHMVTHLHIIGLSFILSQGYNGPGLIWISNCESVFISDTAFQGSVDIHIPGRAINILDSEATIFRCVFKDLVVTDLEGGGAIHRTGAILIIRESDFISNVAVYYGGAIYSIGTNLTIQKSSFVNNSVINMGGAIFAYESNLLLISETIFDSNTAGFGGAISLIASNITCDGRVSMLKNTAIFDGGALYIKDLSFLINADHLTLMKNAAERGGAMYVNCGNITLHGNVTVERNTAKFGGGIRADRSSINVTDNCSLTMAENNATHGGAIDAYDSMIFLQGQTLFTHNTADGNGGGINTLYGKVSLQGFTKFTHNTAGGDGGATFAAGTAIQIVEQVNFSCNSAFNGGAMFFQNGASLHLDPIGFGTLLISSFNFACQDGGVIYHRDSPSNSQCEHSDIIREDRTLPDCFLQPKLHYAYHTLFFLSTNDSARREGNVMFGGLMDRCKIENGLFGESWISGGAISIYPDSKPSEREISSKPYSLCFCNINHTCTAHEQGIMKVATYRGQKVTIHLVAKMQYGTTPTTVTAVITSSKARLETYQTSQQLPDKCTPLSYTVYSNEGHEQVVLYPDGPCRDTGKAKVVIDVTLLPCPDGFTKSGEICTCEDRLQDYPVTCTIADTPYLTKKTGLDFWIGVSHINATYQGLVLCKSCPAEYCKKGVVKVTIDNPDMQCDLNRNGLLCGACAANHSLMLGSSLCQVCPNTYLALLLPFAAAGMALVVFLTSLRLTVATGILNSVILCANIFQAKRNLFFPSNTRNPLTVFIAWVNLDLGFQTCFYDGLDAYALTWLQFAFPLYVWLIIASIIVISRYSITLSKLIGSNPVAVLATLLLMSYTKILKIIIEVYSYKKLDYPDNRTVPVWFKDANVPYLESKHLFLTMVTSLVLVFLFLPYTLILLLGYKLYHFTGKKHWCWLNRLKPLLDSYYAPYKNHTRYWTGFLLLVRCALYIVFSLSSASKSLLAITLTFAAMGFTIGYFRIYRSMTVNLTEACVYTVLSVHALALLNTVALVYSLVGLVFMVMLALIVHQFHLLYIAKTALWLRLKNKWSQFRSRKAMSSEVQSSSDIFIDNPLHDPHSIVTKTVVELREPLLDS